jgi:hypothetical protein
VANRDWGTGALMRGACAAVREREGGRGLLTRRAATSRGLDALLVVGQVNGSDPVRKRN